MQDHLTNFNNDWSRLRERTSSSKDELGKSFLALTQSNHAKAAFLLVSLPESMNNIVDNLQTKPNLTFEDVHARLLDLNANHTLPSKGEKAYWVQKSGADNSGANLKECTWCKKRGLNAKGHTWQVCNKLKAKNKERKEQNSEEKAHRVSKEITDGNSSTVATAFMVSPAASPTRSA